MAKTLSSMIADSKKKQGPKREWVPNYGGNLIIQARAGTGKTFSMLQGIEVIQGRKPKYKPSPQQAVIWNELKGYYRNKRLPRFIGIVAFNKSIQQELSSKVPQGVTAKTTHALGMSAMFKAYGKGELRDTKYRDLFKQELGTEKYVELQREDPEYINNSLALVNYVRSSLSGRDEDGNWIGASVEELEDLAINYGLLLNGTDRELLQGTVNTLLSKGRELTSVYDFGDMVWLPVINKLPCFRYSLLFVDEAQDLDRCKQELCLMSSERLVICGDPKQAIYGFAGADVGSMSRMERILEERGGVKVLPLTVTRRCCKAVVELARKLVPDFQAHEDNPQGAVHRISKGAFEKKVAAEDMVLCRVNAPLVATAFALIKDGRKATIIGRDIGKGLLSLIRKSKTTTVEELLSWMDEYFTREKNRLAQSDKDTTNAMVALDDKHSCLKAFCDGATSLEEVKANIRKVFDTSEDDKKQDGIPETPGVILASVHRSKGLEADNVFILCPDLMPHPAAKLEWELEQELNLKYVAITRAISNLYWVV